MTARLRDNPLDLAALVALTARALDVPTAYVEKDFWVTEVLRAASATGQVKLRNGDTAPVEFIFKGGTSLSRVFRLIERFSEDVDLLAVFPEEEATFTARHATLKAVDKAVVAHLGLQSTVKSSTTGVKRYTMYGYPTQSSGDGLKEGVLLELGSRGGDYPASIHAYRSMVADYANDVLHESDGQWEEFAEFEVKVLAPERTLLEKLAAVHDAAVRADNARLDQFGRHFYDIARLLSDAGVQHRLRALGHDGLRALVNDVNDNSDAASFTWSPRPGNGYASSPAFDLEHPTHVAIARGYTAAQALIYGAWLSLEDALGVVQRHRDLI